MKPQQPKIYWREIKEQYPKAFKIFWDWIITYDEICDYDIECLENRILVLGGCDFTEFVHFNKGDLYSFFDQLGLIIRVAPIFDSEHDKVVYQWQYMINEQEEFSPGGNSRPTCEEKAFLKAFELLNEK